MFRPLSVATLLIVGYLVSPASTQAQLTEGQQILKDQQDFAQNEGWFYDDLDAAVDEAAKTKRPLIIVFR